MEMIGKLFADNLRRFREKRKMTQDALSERLGMSVVSIQNYENQRRWPDPDVIDRLCAALAVSPADFFLAPGEVPKPDPLECLEIVREALLSAQSPAVAPVQDEEIDALERELDDVEASLMPPQERKKRPHKAAK